MFSQRASGLRARLARNQPLGVFWMSTGSTAVMELAADGSGNITLTNLDEFGAQPVPLAKQTFDGKIFAFTATGSRLYAMILTWSGVPSGTRIATL